MSPPAARRRAREMVLQGLYERQITGTRDADIAAALLADTWPAIDDEQVRASDDAAAEVPSRRPVDIVYFNALWDGVTREYDALLQAVSSHVSRSVDGLTPIERALLVIGAWELKHRADVPYRAVINEAVELARTYGGTDGHKFVNGVLDKLVPGLRAEALAPLPAKDE